LCTFSYVMQMLLYMINHTFPTKLCHMFLPGCILQPQFGLLMHLGRTQDSLLKDWVRKVYLKDYMSNRPDTLPFWQHQVSRQFVG